jgi:hypothetical protein
VVGDDRRRPLHDRLPIRVGDGGDEHRAVLETVDLLRAGQVADLPGGDGIADRQPAQQPLATFLEAVRPQHRSLFARLHRLRPGLDHVELVAVAVLGPLDVHGTAVVVFDHGRPPGQHQDLPVVEHGRRLLLLGGLDRRRGLVAGVAVDDLRLLAPGLPGDHRIQVFPVEQGLEDHVLVRVDLAGDHRLSEAPGGVDEDRAWEPAVGVDGERHPGSGPVGADHLLDADGQRHLEVVEPLVLPVADRPVREQRGVAALAGVQQRLFPGDVEEGLLLTGEAGLGQVLGRGAAPHRHIRAVALQAGSELPVGLPDRLSDGRWELGVGEPPADGVADFGQIGPAV